ncbi:MAG TPA: glycosyltransferase, partial [Chitinophaga sp.]
MKHESVPSLKHIMYRNRGASRNVLYLVYKVFTSFRDVDIVHVRSYLPMIPALLLKLFFRKKVIFDMRGVLPEETLLRKGSRLQYKLLWWLEAVSSRYADKIVVVSNAFREIMLKRRNVPADRVVVIPTFSANSVKKSAPSADVPDLKKDIFTQDNILFVYSGAFEKWQCAEEVVIFFKVVQQYIPEARLVVLSRNVQEFEALLKQHFETGLYYVSNARNEH